MATSPSLPLVHPPSLSVRFSTKPSHNKQQESCSHCVRARAREMLSVSESVSVGEKLIEGLGEADRAGACQQRDEPEDPHGRVSRLLPEDNDDEGGEDAAEPR
jgi:hypothetical protein